MLTLYIKNHPIYVGISKDVVNVMEIIENDEK
jgi:hypothetical protein